jgi:hypothetical protein
VNEDVLPRLALNEPKPLRCLEPLDHTLFSSQSSYPCSSDVPIRMLVTPAGRTAEPAPRWSCTPPTGLQDRISGGVLPQIEMAVHSVPSAELLPLLALW